MLYIQLLGIMFYSHVNYSVTKISIIHCIGKNWFYSHVNYSVTKIGNAMMEWGDGFTVT